MILRTSSSTAANSEGDRLPDSRCSGCDAEPMVDEEF